MLINYIVVVYPDSSFLVSLLSLPGLGITPCRLNPPFELSMKAPAMTTTRRWCNWCRLKTVHPMELIAMLLTLPVASTPMIGPENSVADVMCLLLIVA